MKLPMSCDSIVIFASQLETPYLRSGYINPSDRYLPASEADG